MNEQLSKSVMDAVLAQQFTIVDPGAVREVYVCGGGQGDNGLKIQCDDDPKHRPKAFPAAFPPVSPAVLESLAQAIHDGVLTVYERGPDLKDKAKRKVLGASIVAGKIEVVLASNA